MDSELMTIIVLNTPKTANESHHWRHAYNKMTKVLKSMSKILPEVVTRDLKPSVRNFISSSCHPPQIDAKTSAVTNDATNDIIMQSNEPPSNILNDLLDVVSMESTNTPKPKPRRSESKHRQIL